MTPPESHPTGPTRNVFVTAKRWLTLPNLQAGATLLLGLLVARSLPPSDFGALASALSFVAILAVLVRLGIEQPLRNELARRPAESATHLGTAMALRVAASAFAYLLLALLAPADASTVWLVAALTLFLQAPLSLHSWLVVDPQRTAYATLAQRIGFGSSVAMRVGLLYSNAPATWYAAALAMEATISALVIFYAHGRLAPADDAFSWDAPTARHWLKAGRWDLGRALLACSPLAVLQVMVLLVSGNGEAGHFSVACLPVEFAFFVLAARAAHVRSKLESADSGPSGESRRTADARLCAWAWIAAVALGGPAYWTARWLFGDDYARSGVPLTVLSVALVPMVLGVLRQPGTSETGKSAALAQGVGLAFALVAGGILAHPWGATGAAAAAVLSLLVTHVAVPLFSRDTRVDTAVAVRAAFLLPLFVRPAPTVVIQPAPLQPAPSETTEAEPVVCLETTAIAHSSTQP